MPEQSRVQLIGYALAAVLVVVAIVKLLGIGRGEAPAPPVRLDRSESSQSGGAAGRGSEVYVHVAGAVRRPGLYRLPRSSRIAMALERAGGATRKAELTGVNLAATVEDGQQIVVPRAGAQPTAAPGAPATSGAGSGGAKVSLATATVEQLDALDGIGPMLAKRIVEYRDVHGGFRSLDELREVEGIGEKRFAALREAVSP